MLVLYQKNVILTSLCKKPIKFQQVLSASKRQKALKKKYTTGTLVTKSSLANHTKEKEKSEVLVSLSHLI